MASRALVRATLALILAAASCKAPEPQSPASPGASPEEATPPVGSGGAGNGAPPAGAPGSPSPAGSTEIGPAPAPSAGAPNERPGPPLPELRVKSFGLHVGGAAKDEEQRREVQRTLERGFPRYLDCYRLVDEPGSEGTFGADLRVEVNGGKPKVSQPRTKFRGEAFRACMVKALESATFDAPSSGRAIVVSYSVKFSFGW